MRSPTRFVIAFFLALSFSNVFSQIVFCPFGAEWNYNFRYFGMGPSEYVLENIKFTGPQIINGEFVKVLKHTRFYRECGSESGDTYLKQNGDTIFFKNATTNHKWQILYNFNVQVGHSWNTTVKYDSNTPFVTYTVVVGAVLSVVENGYTLKQLSTRYYYNPSSYVAGLITERFGCAPFFFNYRMQIGYCDIDRIDRFLCYSDSEFGTKQFSERPCDYISVGIANNESRENGIQVHPNPNNGSFQVTFDPSLTQNLSYTLYNMYGQAVKAEFTGSEGRIDVNCPELSKGIYFLSIKHNGRILCTQKVVRE